MIYDLEDGGSWGYGGGARGVTIGHFQDLTVCRRRGGAGRPLGMDRSGREQRRIDRRAVSEQAAEVVTGAATATTIATEATMMTEVEWEDPPVTALVERIHFTSPLVCVCVRNKERGSKS